MQQLINTCLANHCQPTYNIVNNVVDEYLVLFLAFDLNFYSGFLPALQFCS